MHERDEFDKDEPTDVELGGMPFKPFNKNEVEKILANLRKQGFPAALTASFEAENNKSFRIRGTEMVIDVIFFPVITTNSKVPFDISDFDQLGNPQLELEINSAGKVEALNQPLNLWICNHDGSESRLIPDCRVGIAPLGLNAYMEPHIDTSHHGQDREWHYTEVKHKALPSNPYTLAETLITFR